MICLWVITPDTAEAAAAALRSARAKRGSVSIIKSSHLDFGQG